MHNCMYLCTLAACCALLLPCLAQFRQETLDVSEDVDHNRLLSVIFITKRPGGLDILLSSFALQTSQEYELIVVDELSSRRRAAFETEATKVGVRLRIVTRSKHHSRKFGIANAINTGLLIASGSCVTILQDNIFVPANFVERTLQFFENQGDALLSYGEIRYIAPKEAINWKSLNDTSAISVFHSPIDRPFSKIQGWKASFSGGTMPPPVHKNMQDKKIIEVDWLECSCCSFSWRLAAALNGVDEVLDVGDDCHERNLKERAAEWGVKTYNDGAVAIELVDHHKWQRSDMWTRFTRDSNMLRWLEMKALMAQGEYPLRAPNAFDIAAQRPEVCDGLSSDAGKLPKRVSCKPLHQSIGNMRTLPFQVVSPIGGSSIKPGLIRVDWFPDSDHEMFSAVYMACAKVVTSPSEIVPQAAISACSTPGPIFLQLPAVVSGVTTLMVYAIDMQGNQLSGQILIPVLVESASDDSIDTNIRPTSIKAGVSVHAGDFVSAGGVLHDSNLCPYPESAECMMKAVEFVESPSIGMIKPHIVFIYAKEPHLVPQWKDGLWAALQILRKHFSISMVNVNHVHVAENPYVNLHIADDVSLVLGWGAFGSPADYVITQLRLQDGIQTPTGLCIGGNAVPPPEHISHVYDVLFYETEWYRPTIQHHGNIYQAFGINTNVYHPGPAPSDADLQYDYVVVGHFLPWKRTWELFKKEGRRLAIGETYPDIPASVQMRNDLASHGVTVSDMLPARELAEIYRGAGAVLLPMEERGGGERSLLEARACGAQVEVAADNSKLQHLLSIPIPSEKEYAEKLRHGIVATLQGMGMWKGGPRSAGIEDLTVDEFTARQLNLQHEN